MSYTELTGKYRRLRAELEAAYAASEWDLPHIDRIADELTEIELALASPAHALQGAPQLDSESLR